MTFRKYSIKSHYKAGFLKLCSAIFSVPRANKKYKKHTSSNERNRNFPKS